MAYVKTNWDTTTPINPTNMNHIEVGIYDTDTRLTKMEGMHQYVNYKDGTKFQVAGLKSKLVSLMIIEHWLNPTTIKTEVYVVHKVSASGDTFPIFSKIGGDWTGATFTNAEFVGDDLELTYSATNYLSIEILNIA